MTTINLPLYWMHESSGVVGAAVKAYLEASVQADPLLVTDEQIEIVREYFEHWVNFNGWDTAGPEFRDELIELRRLILKAHSVGALNRWTRKALGIGIDPL